MRWFSSDQPVTLTRSVNQAGACLRLVVRGPDLEDAMDRQVSVGEALETWRRSIGMGGSAYDAPTLDIVFDPRLPPLRVRNPGFTHWHDLHHVAMGVGFDFRGEVSVSAWEFVTGSPSWAVWRLNVMGVVAGLLAAPRLTLRTMWRARFGRNLYRRTDYDAVLSWPVWKLRAYLNLGDAS